MPKLRSRRPVSVAIGRSTTAAIAFAVSWARARSLAKIASMPSPASASATRDACQRPRALRRGVELALHPHLGVPLRLAVADGDDPRHLFGAQLHPSRRFSV